jgi:micrococcal nuclease
MILLSALIVIFKFVTGAYGTDLKQLKNLYFYEAVVTSVYDGDTITANIDLGLNIWIHNAKLRLYGIDTPEVRGPERQKGLQARDRLRELVLNREVTLKTYKDKKGKFGRYLAIIFISDPNGKGLLNINELLKREGLAVPFMENK